MILGNKSTQYDQAEAFYERMKLKGQNGKMPIVVGHSKGGNLAAYIASISGYCSAYLFNPMPLHANYVNQENLATCNIQTYVAENDFIATLLSLFTPEEITILLQELSIHDLKRMLNGDTDNLDKLLLSKKFELIDLGLRLRFYIKTGKILMFNGNFQYFLKNNTAYLYSGNVHLEKNNSFFWNMVSSIRKPQCH